MIRTITALVAFAVAACTPQQTGPEAAVTAIYKPLVDSSGAEGTQVSDLPLTMDLALKIQELETRAEEQVFDFDVAGNCQNCTGFSNLKVTTPTEPSLAPRDGHSFVEATFTIANNEQKAMFFDLIQTDGVWQIDNIFTEGFDLRLIADDMLANQAVVDEPAVGTMQCMVMLQLHAGTLSKATPPADTVAYDSAYAGYRAMAELAMAPEDVSQLLASSVSMLADIPADEVASKASACLAGAPPAPPAR